MAFNNRIIFTMVLAVICCSCIKQVNVATRDVAPILVAEGNITTDSVPYTVKLSYSGRALHADSLEDAYLEKQATVTISDDQGNSTPLQYTSQGVYKTTDPSYIGKVGRSYFMTVVLKDGKRYVSVPEKMPAPVGIDSVSVKFNDHFDMFVPTSMDVYINTKDPAPQENYYRWTFNTWVGRVTPGVSCGFGCIMFEYCYQQFINKEVIILSDAAINGNNIKDKKVGACYIYSYFNPFVDIGQLSMTREAYQFWKRYQDQQTRTGGILDPLPAAIKGNVYNAANPDEFALGYFSASAVVHRKVILVPFSITAYQLLISAQQFIPDGPVACFDYYPNTLSYPPPPAQQYPPPPGWENAEEIKVYW